MSAWKAITLKSAAAVLLVASSATAAGAYDPQAQPHDNSGRQIAAIIPGLPHPPAPVPTAVKAGSGGMQLNDSVGSLHTHLSSISTPIHLSPEAQDALVKGLTAAQGLSNVALRRVTDCGAWVAVLFRNFSDLPLATPATAISVPTLQAPPMKAIEDPGKGIKLIYTNERRFRTVVGR